jgi:FkbM family methyltransferase
VAQQAHKEKIAMNPFLQTMRKIYWTLRPSLNNWRHHRHELSRRLGLRARAWLNPIFELDGIKLHRGTGLSLAVLGALESGEYEAPESRIVRHALQPGDCVLELGTGLGFLASICAQQVGNESVHTFEANPALERVIHNNFRLNDVAPQLHINLLGDEDGTITFYVMKNFWSSSTIQRHPKARPIQVPMKRFNDELANLRPNFLIIDIEGGERDLIRYARLDGVQKVCIELHPHVIGKDSVAEVEAFFISRGFHEDLTISDPDHKLYLRQATQNDVAASQPSI